MEHLHTIDRLSDPGAIPAAPPPPTAADREAAQALAAEIGALIGWPCQRWEKAGYPVVYLYPVGAPPPGPAFQRVKPLVALGMDPHHSNVFIHRQDPLAHLAEPVP